MSAAGRLLRRHRRRQPRGGAEDGEDAKRRVRRRVHLARVAGGDRVTVSDGTGTPIAISGASASGEIVAVPPAADLALEAVSISKHFGSFTALGDVSLRLRRGTVHALLGENGAGKSTLVKCIMGYYQADAGRVLVGGLPSHIKNPRDAAALGIGMVYQHFTLVDNMTVAENLVLARRNLPFVFDWAAEHRNVAAFMEKMPFKLDPGRPVRTLAAGEKQKL